MRNHLFLLLLLPLVVQIRPIRSSSCDAPPDNSNEIYLQIIDLISGVEPKCLEKGKITDAELINALGNKDLIRYIERNANAPAAEKSWNDYTDVVALHKAGGGSGGGLLSTLFGLLKFGVSVLGTYYIMKSLAFRFGLSMVMGTVRKFFTKTGLRMLRRFASKKWSKMKFKRLKRLRIKRKKMKQNKDQERKQMKGNKDQRSLESLDDFYNQYSDENDEDNTDAEEYSEEEGSGYEDVDSDENYNANSEEDADQVYANSDEDADDGGEENEDEENENAITTVINSINHNVALKEDLMKTSFQQKIRCIRSVAKLTYVDEMEKKARECIDLIVQEKALVREMKNYIGKIFVTTKEICEKIMSKITDTDVLDQAIKDTCLMNG